VPATLAIDCRSTFIAIFEEVIVKHVAFLAVVVAAVFAGRWSMSRSVMAQDRAAVGATSQPVELAESPGRFRTVYFQQDQDHALIDSETGRLWHLVKSSDGTWVLQEFRRVDAKQ
jgi:hypothetical protein